jgi:hypothetical protein
VLERIGLIKGLLVDSKAAIRIKGEIVGNFSLDMGLKQGSIFSPLLFFGAMIDAWQKELAGKGIPMYFKFKGEFWSVEGMMNKCEGQPFTLSDLLFADDAEIVARDAKELQLMLDAFVEVTVAFGQEPYSGDESRAANCWECR